MRTRIATKPLAVIPLTIVLAFATVAGAADWWRVTTVADVGDVGRFSSLVILPDGNPAISYHAASPASELHYAQFDGQTWHTSIVDDDGSVGGSTSIAMLPSGRPAISYYDYTAQRLKYAWSDGETWHVTVVTEDGDSGAYSSLAILPSGLPAIAYYDDIGEQLMYAEFDGVTWGTTEIDDGDWGRGETGLYTSMAVLPDGCPAISYYDEHDGDLRYAWFDGDQWQTETVHYTYDVGLFTSIAVLPDGNPAISYYQDTDAYHTGSLKYAHYTGSYWHYTTVDHAGDVGWHTSLAILPTGQPAISYRDVDNGALKYAGYDGQSWNAVTVDIGVNVGWYTSLSILPTGQPAISYYDWSAGDLKYATAFPTGDLNCDGMLDFDDIDAFVAALTGEVGYCEDYPDCNWLLADCNDDLAVDFNDIDAFVDLLGGQEKERG